MGKKKILLIEDNPDHADLIIDELDLEDYENEIILLKDGQTAIDSVQKIDIDNKEGIKSQIGLIVLDLNLPKVHGLDVLKFLKNNSNCSSIPVIIMSTSSDSETISKAYENGADNFMIKPISYEEFVNNIKLLRECWLMGDLSILMNNSVTMKDKETNLVYKYDKSLDATVKNAKKVADLTDKIAEEYTNRSKKIV